MPDKAAVFIDGGYFKKVRENFGDPKTDFLRLSDDLCKRCSCERFRTYIYDCAPFQSTHLRPKSAQKLKSSTDSSTQSNECRLSNSGWENCNG